jgi:hypothetical protein
MTNIPEEFKALIEAADALVAFGKPSEGSIRYHAAWKQFALALASIKEKLPKTIPLNNP